MRFTRKNRKIILKNGPQFWRQIWGGPFFSVITVSVVNFYGCSSRDKKAMAPGGVRTQKWQLLCKAYVNRRRYDKFCMGGASNPTIYIDFFASRRTAAKIHHIQLSTRISYCRCGISVMHYAEKQPLNVRRLFRN